MTENAREITSPKDNQKIKDLFRLTTDRMFTALESYYLWKKFSQMINVNEVGEVQAKENVAFFQKYWKFFHPVFQSSYKSFVTDLSIFFDASKYDETFSLKKLIEEIKTFVSEAEYEAIVNEISVIKKRHGVTIDLILELRNREVAHQEMDRKSREVIFKDIEDLFKGVQEILNLLSKYYNRGVTYWDHIEEDVLHSFDWVKGNLQRGEKVRLREIEEKYNIELPDDVNH